MWCPTRVTENKYEMVLLVKTGRQCEKEWAWFLQLQVLSIQPVYNKKSIQIAWYMPSDSYL